MVRGIPPFRQERFTPAQIALLGTVPDRDLAETWGVHTTTVADLRKRNGVPAFQAQKHWTPEEVALLGTMPDAEVARRVGRSREAVHTARLARGIRLVGSKPHPHLDDIKREYTTTNASVSDIAAKYGVSREFVTKRAHKRRWVRPPQ